MAFLTRFTVTEVSEYRAYIMGPNGHIRRRIDFISADDETAKEHARQFVDGHDVELWQIDRKVCEFKAKQ
ncbi:hypothetical protein UP10_15475 [Bradyrhizobium sp. LTSPM299]|nr:hypothetical protein UP10_15475 [Bradyrhizobium sp. LTSPM299]